MSYQVSADEFEGEGPGFSSDLESRLGDRAMEEAMKILEHPEIHDPKLRKKKKAKVVSKTYNLSDEADRKAYEDDVARVLNCEPGSLLLLDRPAKQFVQIGESYRYVAYLEWAEYIDSSKSDAEQNKNLVQTEP